MSTDHRRVREAAAANIERSARRLLETPAESLVSLSDIMVILESLGVLARETLNSEFPAIEDIDEIEGRSNWMKAIFILAETGLFPGMPGLWLALSELTRGRQLDSVAPLIAGKGSGSRTPYQRLTHMKRAVEAGGRIERLCLKQAERDAHLRACGTTKWSLDRYRHACEEGAPAFWIDPDACNGLNLAQAQLLLRAEIHVIKAASQNHKAD